MTGWGVAVSSELVDIIFRGDILPGHTLPAVKQRLAQLFKADEARINALFAGSAVPLKRNLDKEAAEKYQAVLRQAGADVQLRSAGQAQQVQRPSRERVDTAATTVVTAAIPAQKAMTLQERLAAAEEQAKQAGVHVVERVAGEEIYDPETGWSIAAVGADMLKPEERQMQEAVAVDVSAISLSETGADLLKATERTQVVPVVVDVSGISVAAVGEDLLDEDEKPLIAVLPIPVSDFDIAPPGSDLGQIAAPPPPPPPDTSAISLAD